MDGKQAVPLVLFLMAGAIVPSRGDANLEYQVKAVCILNAARFVTWPANAFQDSSSPIVIGVLGDNPFGSTLQSAVQGETIQRRPIVIRRVSLEEAASHAHIVFVSRSERDRLEGVLNRLSGSSVLTVSEIERFASSGGVIGLTLDRGKIRFEVNETTARKSGLKIGAQFLSLARVVK